MTRLMNNMSESKFSSCQKPHKYKKLLYALCWFHSILVDRRKFQNLGWNIPYDFNDSDFEVSELCLRLYLDEYDETPWDALKYLISEINYGGRVTDDNDRRLMNVYMSTYFNEDALAVPQFRLSPLPNYVIPEDGPLSSYRDLHRPAAARQAGGLRPAPQRRHRVADRDGHRDARDDRLAAAAQRGPAARRREMVYALADDLLGLIPGHRPDRQGGAVRRLGAHVVLVRGQRYCALLGKIRKLLINVKKGIKGLVVMSADLDAVFQKLRGRGAARVALGLPVAQAARLVVTRPDRALAAAHRVVRQGAAKVFWLAGFTYPTGMLRRSCRRPRAPTTCRSTRCRGLPDCQPRGEGRDGGA